MICPIMSTSAYAGIEQCHGSECAWWHEKESQCAILSIAANMNNGGKA